MTYTEGDTGVDKLCQVDRICDKIFLDKMEKIATTVS